jgi:hypothetical protein
MNETVLTLRAFNALFPDEDAARAWFERARWPDGPTCYHCGTQLRGQAESPRPEDLRVSLVRSQNAR